MSIRRHSSRSVLSFLSGLALVVAACGGKAVVDPTGGGGTGGTASGTGGTGAGASAAGGSGAGTPGSTAGVVFGTSEITMSLASFNLTCADPDPSLPNECGWWLLDVRMSADKLVVGPLDLDDPSVDAFSQSAVVDPDDPNICSGGGGTFLGTVEISAVTDSEVAVTVSDTFEWQVPAGDYTATRCP